MLINLWRAVSMPLQQHKISFKTKLFIAAVIITLYGCSPESRLTRLILKHPELIAKIDTIKAKKRFLVLTEKGKADYDKSVLQFNPLKIGDSLTFTGKRFRTTIRNNPTTNKTEVSTVVSGIDTTFTFATVVNHFPDLWVGKYNKLQLSYYKLLVWVVGLGALLALGIYARVRRFLP